MDPVSLALAKAAVQEHADRADNPHQVTAAQVGAITAVGGISNPGGNVDIVGGAAVSITRDAVNKRLIIDVDADGVVPGPHASTHAAGGSDEITPAMIGAAAATHQHAADDVTSGVFPVARGGTGLSSLTAGSYLRAASTSAFELRTPAQVLSDIGAAPASHTHSPTDVGLGNVQNYGIATQAEAEAGSVNNKYMTPLRVAQAIAALHAKSQVVVATGSVQDGGTVPLPSGYTQDQCWWMVTVGDTGAINQYFGGLRCYAGTNRVVTAKWWDSGVSQWKSIGSVRYIIIGVK